MVWTSDGYMMQADGYTNVRLKQEWNRNNHVVESFVVNLSRSMLGISAVKPPKEHHHG